MPKYYVTLEFFGPKKEILEEIKEIDSKYMALKNFGIVDIIEVKDIED
jgi:hypothetical protein